MEKKAEWLSWKPHAAHQRSPFNYLIVSSSPLSCWNLLWRFLICSSETEKKQNTKFHKRQVNETPRNTPHPLKQASGNSNQLFQHDNKQKITAIEMHNHTLWVVHLMVRETYRCWSNQVVAVIGSIEQQSACCPGLSFYARVPWIINPRCALVTTQRKALRLLTQTG